MIKGMEIFLKEPDTIELFGTSGSGKTTFALALADDFIKDGKKVKYIDTEKNLINIPKGMEYIYTPSFEGLKKEVGNTLSKKYDLVIVDSIGLPILGKYVSMSLNEQGNILKELHKMCYDLKVYSKLNNALSLVLNQPESEFGKSKDHIFRPFGDKSIYFFKEVWKTEIQYSMPNKTSCFVSAHRSRLFGMGKKLFNIVITKEGSEIKYVAE